LSKDTAAPSQTLEADLVIHNGYVVTLDEARRVIDPGAVAIKGRRIVAVGAEREILDRVRGGRRIDAEGGVIHPGYVEPHNHVNLQFMRAMLIDLQSSPGNGGLRAVLTPEDERAGALVACAEMIRNGYTSFAEPGTALHTDAVADACREIGMRTWLSGPFLWDRNDDLPYYRAYAPQALIDRLPASLDRSLMDAERELKRNDEPDALVRGYVCPYGEISASTELLQATRALARAHGVAWQTHVNFTAALRERAIAIHGAAPVVHFARLGLLDDATTLVHLNALDEAEFAILSETQANLVWVAANYLRTGSLSDGPTRMPELAARGAHVALGADTRSNFPISDGQLVGYFLSMGMKRPLPPERILEMLTLAPARAMLASSRIGSLETGKLADIVVRERTGPGWDTSLNPLNEMLFVARAAPPRSVIIDGREVFHRGTFTTIDEGNIHSDAKQAAVRVLGRFGLRLTRPSADRR